MQSLYTDYFEISIDGVGTTAKIDFFHGKENKQVTLVMTFQDFTILKELLAEIHSKVLEQRNAKN